VEHLWGVSKTLFQDDRTSLVRFVAEAGGSSSLHYHDQSSNLISVCSGTVEVYQNHSALWRVLDAGESTMIPPGVPHRLRFVTDAVGYELYVSSPGSDFDSLDIHRMGTGVLSQRRVSALDNERREKRAYRQEWYRRQRAKIKKLRKGK
jgi:quercetin dioxygenase-like cupin family protein